LNRARRNGRVDGYLHSALAYAGLQGSASTVREVGGARVVGMERHAVGGQAEVGFLVELGHQRGDERGGMRFADGDEGEIG
jgi:hypothetical protein